MPIVRIAALCAITLALFATSAARAQTYVETFDQGPAATMLNGAVTYGTDDTWSARIANGRLLLVNSGKEAAVRYYRLEQLPFDSGPQATENATIEAAVTVEADGRAAIGVITRFDPKHADYLMFGIGAQGDYYVVVRKQGKARIAIAARSDAIRANEINRVRARPAGSNIVFEVNGREITRFPTDGLPGGLVGIGAFGRGLFSFDEVRVTLPGTP